MLASKFVQQAYIDYKQLARTMYLHEYQAKELLLEYGCPIAPFKVAQSMQEVEHALTQGLVEAVVKIQVHAGGRGKAGGVKLAKSPQEIREHAKNLLGMRLVNIQTGPEGVVAKKILLDTPVAFTRQFYLGIIIDRKNGGVSIIASPEGGVEIEEVAQKHPEKIFVERVAPSRKLYHFQLMRLLKNLGWTTALLKEQGSQLIQQLLTAFFELDATLLEINPLVETADGLVALDAKLSIDDNALYRHPRLAAMWDPFQASSAEVKAHEHELSYVALDGNIGCIVNGAGLAMATMDLIRFWGGKPANFLDVGGSASIDKVAEGFKILFYDPSVKAILVNIFGGIMNCEIIAQALIKAQKEVGYKGHIVLRMEGTNVESAKKMLQDAHVVTEDSLDEAAKKVVHLAGE